MGWRLLLIYVVVELTVVCALGLTIGFGWTLLMLLVVLVFGFVLLAPLGGWQLGRQLLQARSGAAEPQSALSNGAILSVATGLVLVPGLVTTTVGLLLLVPPIRAAARPHLTALAVRGLLRSVPLPAEAAASVANAFNPRNTRQDAESRDFIDGEVIDIIDVEPPPWPQGSIPPRPTSS